MASSPPRIAFSTQPVGYTTVNKRVAARIRSGLFDALKKGDKDLAASYEKGAWDKAVFLATSTNKSVCSDDQWRVDYTMRDFVQNARDFLFKQVCSNINLLVCERAELKKEHGYDKELCKLAEENEANACRHDVYMWRVQQSGNQEENNQKKDNQEKDSQEKDDQEKEPQEIMRVHVKETDAGMTVDIVQFWPKDSEPNELSPRAVDTDTTKGQGEIGGHGEGLKVAAYKLLANFPQSSVHFIMNEHIWKAGFSDVRDKKKVVHENMFGMHELKRNGNLIPDSLIVRLFIPSYKDDDPDYCKVNMANQFLFARPQREFVVLNNQWLVLYEEDVVYDSENGLDYSTCLLPGKLFDPMGSFIMSYREHEDGTTERIFSRGLMIVDKAGSIRLDRDRRHTNQSIDNLVMSAIVKELEGAPESTRHWTIDHLLRKSPQSRRYVEPILRRVHSLEKDQVIYYVPKDFPERVAAVLKVMNPRPFLFETDSNFDETIATKFKRQVLKDASKEIHDGHDMYPTQAVIDCLKAAAGEKDVSILIWPKKWRKVVTSHVGIEICTAYTDRYWVPARLLMCVQGQEQIMSEILHASKGIQAQIQYIKEQKHPFDIELVRRIMDKDADEGSGEEEGSEDEDEVFATAAVLATTSSASSTEKADTVANADDSSDGEDYTMGGVVDGGESSSSSSEESSSSHDKKSTFRSRIRTGMAGSDSSSSESDSSDEEESDSDSDNSSRIVVNSATTSVNVGGSSSSSENVDPTNGGGNLDPTMGEDSYNAGADYMSDREEAGNDAGSDGRAPAATIAGDNAGRKRKADDLASGTSDSAVDKKSKGSAAASDDSQQTVETLRADAEERERKLKVDLEREKERADAAQRAIERLEGEKAAALVQLEEAKEELVKLRKEVRVVSARADEAVARAEQKNVTLQKEKDEALKQAVVAKEKYLEVKKKLEEVAVAFEKVKLELQDKENEVLTLKGSNIELKAQKDDVATRLQAAERTIENLQTQVEVLNKLIKDQSEVLLGRNRHQAEVGSTVAHVKPEPTT